MDFQRLPLPVGSPHPVRRARRPGVTWSERGRSATVLLGLIAAAGGAALGAAPPNVTVAMDAGAYRVGDVVLAARGGGVYAGPEGAVVVSGATGAGSTRLNGVRTLGSCTLAPDGSGERCTFDVGGRRIRAEDRLAGGGWERRYSDGAKASIPLRGGRPIPVPFPLGR